MKEKMIHQFEVDQLEETLRLISNYRKAQDKPETCMDRQIKKSAKIIEEVNKRSND